VSCSTLAERARYLAPQQIAPFPAPGCFQISSKLQAYCSAAEQSRGCFKFLYQLGGDLEDVVGL